MFKKRKIIRKMIQIQIKMAENLTRKMTVRKMIRMKKMSLIKKKRKKLTYKRS